MASTPQLTRPARGPAIRPRPVGADAGTGIAMPPLPGARARALTWSARHPWLIVAALALVGLAVRLLMVRGIWLDEAISVHQAQMSLPDMIEDLRETDRHPPLHHLILWVFVRLFGDGELAVRLPSMIATTALVPALFATGRAMFDRRTGLVAAALGAIAPLIVWYGQEARMYALFMLLTTLALWAQVRVLRDGRPRNWVIYGGITIALLYTHYFALIPILIQQVVFGIAAWKRATHGHPVKSLLTGCWLTWLALVLAAAPLAPFAHEQLTSLQAAAGAGVTSAGGATASDVSVSVYGVISNFVWSIWGYHANGTMFRIAALWPLLMLVSLALLGRGRSAQTRVLFVMAFGPVLALMLVGLFKREVFEVRYFAGAVPLMILLLARAAAGARHRTAALAGTLALVASFAIALADQQLSPANPREYDFRGALEEVRAEAGPGDVILYAPNSLRPVVSYYAPEVEARPLRDPAEEAKATGGHIYLLASFLDNPSMVRRVTVARESLTAGKRELLQTDERVRIRVWEFG